MRTFTILVLLLGLLCPFTLRADDKIEQPSYQVTVTADRLEEPLTDKSDSITVITAQQMEAQQIHYVIDALREVPGMTILQSGSPGKVTSYFLRGASPSQVLVLIDGVPVNNPYFGGVDLENLTTDQVDRIEVLKGPQSPLYGSDSIGGVIQIFTRKGTAGPPRFQTSFEGGSMETLREKAAITGGTSNLDYNVSYSRNDSNGQFRNDDFRENSATASAGYRFDDQTKLRFNTQVNDAKAGIPFNYIFAPSPLQEQQTGMTLAGVSLERATGDLLNFTGRFSFVHRRYFYEDPQNALFSLSRNSSNSYLLNLQDDIYAISSNVITIGGEAEHQDIRGEDNTGVYPLRPVNHGAMFLQDKLELASWIVAAGLRYDHYNSFGGTVNPRVSVGYKLAPAWKLRGSYGRGFRAPTATDLDLPFYGNPDLKPERSRSWEAGIDHYWGGGSSISASWFDNRYEDLISFDPVTFIAGNVARATSRGFEVQATTSRSGWSLTAGYTHLKTRDETTGLPLFRRPENLAAISGGYGNTKWGANLSVNVTGERLETDYRAFPSENVFNPGYAKIDLAAYYQLTRALRVKARIENLTDKSYQEVLNYPAPGRAVYAGVDASF